MFQQRKAHAVLSLILTASLSTGSFAAPSSAFITPTHAESIYRQLLEHHWTPKTGLFRSFPDSGDLKMSQQASTYEQAAMGILAIRFGDMERAEDLLRFFRKTWDTGPEIAERRGLRGFVNFYNADFGSEGIEKTIHAGPNAWVGLFAAKLANASKNPDALALALDIQYWMMNVLPHKDGAVAMGVRDDPFGAAWSRIYSTENNLSYYSFLTELLRSPRIELRQRTAITQERDRLENWLVKSAYLPSEKRLVRGTNPEGLDKTQALDTTTWLISAVGPRRLAARGINPYQLMEKAAETFEVKVGDRTGVDASDQSEADRVYVDLRSNLNEINRPGQDGHRVIWYEGLGQYILAWNALAEYASNSGEKEKATAYLKKSSELMQEFDQAALTHYKAKSAYPYATPGKFFRYGWGAPKESDHGPAASLISGVWRCFSGAGWDPLAGRDVGTMARVRVSVPKEIQLAERKPAVLYGTSEDMVTEAWKALNAGNWDHATRQAEATIQEWSGSARYLQKMKMRDIGQLVEYSGDAKERKTIFKYWALNDVASAYFILGQAQDHRGNFVKASRAFEQVVINYSLAQVWDPKGWFWSPVEAITNDYVLRDRTHYGWVVPQAFVEGSKFGKLPN